MKIRITDSQECVKTDGDRIRKAARRVLQSEGRQDAEVSILLVDEDQMCRMNKEYLGRDGPTDVLAFRMADGEHARLNPFLLGDVVVSTAEAVKQSKERRTNVHDEICLYVIHGILHLLGYDDTRADDRAVMSRKQQGLLERKR